MKKIILLVLVVTIVCLSLLGSGVISAFALSESECDKVFMETVDGLIGEYYSNDVQITSEKELVYDIQLEPLGYIYLFSTYEESGYAIVINVEGFYECTEIYFDAKNPYEGYDSNKIYVTTLLYLVYENGTYINVDNNEVVTEELISLLLDKAYLASNDFTYSSETITFTARTDNKYDMVMRAPLFTSTVGASGCVPVAGGNLIIFFDRYATNLIPNFEPGSSLAGHYLYKAITPETIQAVATLRTYMGTSDGGGTTIPGFKTGMTRFCNEKGYNISYDSCMNGNSFNYNYAKQRIELGQPLVIFTDPYTVDTLTLTNPTEYISTMYGSLPHSMSVFGFRDITYTLTNGQTRSDSYLFVATGLDVRSSGFCKLNSTTIIDDAYAINIS